MIGIGPVGLSFLQRVRTCQMRCGVRQRSLLREQHERAEDVNQSS